MATNTCKLHQTSTACFSVTRKLGQTISWRKLNLTAQVLGLHLVYHWCHLCKMGSGTIEIRPQLAVLGYSVIFSIKAYLRLLTTLSPTRVVTKVDLRSVYSLRNTYLAQSTGPGSVGSGNAMTF